MFEPKTIGKARADFLIKLQPFYGDVFWERVTSLTAQRWIKDLAFYTKPLGFFNQPKQRIRRQPFFGVDSSAPTTIKFRRPVAPMQICTLEDHPMRYDK